MLTFIGANVPNPALLVFFIVVAGGALTFAWAWLHHPKDARTAVPSTVTYRGVRLRMHPSVPAGKIVVLDPSGYTLTQMTMQMLDGLSHHSGAAVLLSRRDFESIFNRVRGLAWRATARDIINF